MKTNNLSNMPENKKGKNDSRKYNIAYIIDGLGMGGAERLLVPVLEKLNREYFEPYVCVFQIKDGNPIASDLASLGISVTLLPVNHLRDLTALPRLIRWLKKMNISLVHTQLEFANILGNLAAKALSLPSICTIHTMPSKEVKAMSRIHQSVEFMILYYFCNQIISVSDEARRYHISISNSRPQNVSTIYNGIELSRFEKIDKSKARLKIRNEFGLLSNSTLITTVAVLRPSKGIQYMLWALPALLNAYSNIYYLIVGDGSYRGTLVEEVEKVGMVGRVIFAGMRRDIPNVLAASDIFVLPTLTEALPTVLAEAMASRLPIVASAVGGVPEMIEDGKNGYLVSPENPDELSTACADLLVSPEKRKIMGDTGWEIVNRKFSIHRQVERLQELYRDQIHTHEK